MSERESRRPGVLERVKAGELRQVDAAARLGLSYRQTKRLYSRYRRGGAAGLVQRRDGSLKLVFRKETSRWREIEGRPAKRSPELRTRKPQPPNQPASNHPWRKPLLAAHGQWG